MRDNYYPALKHISKIANSFFGFRKICNSIAKSTTKTVHGDACCISLLNPQKEYLITVGAYGLSDLYLRKGPLDARKSLPEILDGKIVFIADATKDERVQHPEMAEAQGISSILGIPILRKGEVIGEIRIYTREPEEFSEADKSFLLSVADICAILLEKGELYLLEKDYKTSKRQINPQVAQLPTNAPRPAFAHPSEEEFAKLLDFYSIEWLYEPRSFPLHWEKDEVAEMFTPDFYLPELDLYVELTTLRQSLITEKNRKVRHLKELYPQINIKLLNKNDYIHLLAKYGYWPLGETKVEGIDRVLYSHTQIQRRVRVLAKRISRDYAGKKPVLVGILKGVTCFMSDLMQHLSLPITLDFMAISYYTSDGQVVKITKDLDSSITGQDVLMVEDIVDTGMTLNYVLKHLSAHKPASLRICTLLDKRARRLIDIPLDYVGFEISDEFVVGYGLDYRGEYRNLSFIGILHPELIEKDERVHHLS
ncbi:MAG: hypoxanthine phosphoribosyltransferase [Chloroflexi bacterium CG_4_9_14_3_um_filter_45_9]|nr:MAG: hypoxanthine phosphoribosyltransferase [Chloroflexi bacterium CG_4_9_14_3_um_filter_45_9]